MDRRPRMMSWNCDGLRPKRPELIQFLAEFDIDVALLQETHLRPGLHFTAPNYAVYRTDRPLQPGARPSGGTAILIHRRVPHRHIPRPGWAMEVTTVAAHFGGSEILLTSIYCPPGSPPVNAELDSLLAPGTPSLVAGDFNCKHPDWGCRITTAGGKRLQRYLQDHQHIEVSAPAHPTHYHHNTQYRPDILDFAIHCDLPTTVTADTVSDLSSDHLPVLLILESPNAGLLPPGRRPKVNWAKYYNYLSDRPRNVPSPTTAAEVDDQVTALQNTLAEAIRASSTPAPEQADHRRKLPPHLQEEVSKRRRLRRRYQRTRCPRDKAAFNRQSLRTKQLLQENSEGRWRDFLDTVTPEDGTLWRLAKSLRKEKPVIRPLHGQGGLVYTPEEKAEAFADSMEAQFSPHADVYDDRHCDRVEDFLDALDGEEEDDEEDDLPEISMEELTAALKKLKPRKAPGPDALGTPALRRLPVWILSWITSLLNSSLRLRHFPTPWKIAKIILIPKPGKNPLFPENHRPISLLPVLSKIFERLILARFPEDFHLNIRDDQFGFRRGHSTTLQLSKVITALVDGRNTRRHITSVSIDVAKAFDRVWHEGLLYKLAHSPLSRPVCKLLSSYLQGRQFSVALGPSNSSLRPIAAGVPQGSVLGPVLYLWYTNDIPVSPRVSVALYADDAFYYVHSCRLEQSVAYMQRQMDLLDPWLEKWRIKVNTSKCEAICFTHKPFNHVLRHHLSLQGDRLSWTKRTRYLGITLSNSMTMGPAADKRLALGRVAFNALGPLLKRSSTLSQSTKMLLYTAIVRPTFTYAAPAWYALTKTTTRKKMEAFQTRCVRQLTNTPWFVRNTVMLRDYGIQSIKSLVREQTERMFAAAEESEWDHIRDWATRDGPPERRFKRPRALLDDPP